MPIVGVEKLYIALQITDTAASLAYGTPAYYEGIKEIAIKPKAETAILYAENDIWDQETLFESADVDIVIADLTSAQKATLLGQTTATDGGVYASKTDEPPYVAILYKANLSRGGYRYGVLYKGKFKLSEDSMKGQEGKKEFQVPKISALFQSNKYNGIWEYHVDTTDPNCPEDIDDTWFTAVTIPDADTTAPTVSVSPADTDINVAVDANVVWTFNEAINSDKVVSANFFIMNASDGSLVSGALSIDAAKKVVTFNPTESLGTSTAYIAICTSNVTDAAGNELAANSITNFTTAV